jgi:CRISPR-associated protein Cmr3
MTGLRFSVLDTWFFRESRPMDTVGGSELASLFPPSPRTLLGAVRTAIGDAQGVDWSAFGADANHPLRAEIGFGDDLGPLALSGPWVCEDGERLYPVPSFLLEKTTGTATELARLRIGAAAHTNLGRVRLPELPKGKQGYKPLEQAWLGAGDLEHVLAGGLPDPTAICHRRQLLEEEPRLGIARDNTRRITDEGLLYQTRHLRPRQTVGLEADIRLAEGTTIEAALVRLGGEGRLAHLAPVDPAPFPDAPKPSSSTRGLILVLLTAARFGSGSSAWLLPGFMPEDQNGVRIWRGEVAGIDLTLHAAVLGKAQREGGWDLALERPRAVQSLIPPGSAYYVTCAQPVNQAIRALHGLQIGEDPALGRGLIACALWNQDEF